ncbi:BTAD domain-containing putative transcriptional regulator [Streptomyces sp. NRRL S-646]|uniref:BTAD domain-containing putative transcriptional regulator n=1 Tax=Streptomyces sp. NRRL S-646 TaxID=1463917 RepID=UPI0004C8A677|nr:BTAD domain-containing putative transcriptional regulator [Streptomyces sp. NRRL S-646]
MRALAAEPGREVLATRPGGQLPYPDDGSLDLREFERLTRSAAEARERSEYAAASARLTAAPAVWRDDALADSRAGHLVHVEAPRRNDARMPAFEEGADVELRLDHPSSRVSPPRGAPSTSPV